MRSVTPQLCVALRLCDDMYFDGSTMTWHGSVYAHRIILKDMHIGMKEDSIFGLLHPDAKECVLRSGIIVIMQCLKLCHRLRQVLQFHMRSSRDMLSMLRCKLSSRPN